MRTRARSAISALIVVSALPAPPAIERCLAIESQSMPSGIPLTILGLMASQPVNWNVYFMFK